MANRNVAWATKLLAMIFFGFAVSESNAAETISYSYDALGRLVRSEISGGSRHGVVQSYEFDSAGNRLQYQVTGAANRSAITLSTPSPVANSIGSGVGISVNVAGGSPTGLVTFSERGVFLGSTWVVDGVASIFLENFPLGLHEITVAYAGDGTTLPQTTTLTIKVQNLSWLPAVLDILLSD